MVAAIVTVISMGTLSWLGATAKEPGASLELVSEWAEIQGFADNPDAVEGATIFASVGCQNCHTYLGSGATNLGAPDLSEIGATSNRGVEGFAAYVADPSEFGNSVMPQYAGFGEENLRKLGEFLQASQGPQ